MTMKFAIFSRARSLKKVDHPMNRRLRAIAAAIVAVSVVTQTRRMSK
jgi:hypothetical protein